MEGMNMGWNIKGNTTSAPFINSELEKDLDLFELDRRTRKTKIVATLGPASVDKIKELMLAGVNVFRLNFSHITDYSQQIPIIREIRKTAKLLKLSIAILGDLCGPKIRNNAFKDNKKSIPLHKGQILQLKATAELSDENTICMNTPQIIKQLQPNQRVLLDDGNIALRVRRRVAEDILEVEVAAGTELKPRKGINVPDITVDIPALTEKDKKDAKFIWEQRLDFIALSFVQRSQDVQDLLDLMKEFRKEDDEKRKIFPPFGIPIDTLNEHDFDYLKEEIELKRDWRPMVISKIEKPQALDEIDDIIKVSDGIMVARGDLGVECQLEKVPIVQKELIRKANGAEKPVITATQMLESMINSPVPTRAEVSDVANAVFDGTDAVMLSGECAAGDYPIETVKMMSAICRTAEEHGSYLFKPDMNLIRLTGINVSRQIPSPFIDAVADSAVTAAEEAHASAIIVYSDTGDTCYMIAKRTRRLNIIAVTSNTQIYRKLTVLSGVHPILTQFKKKLNRQNSGFECCCNANYNGVSGSCGRRNSTSAGSSRRNSILSIGGSGSTDNNNNGISNNTNTNNCSCGNTYNNNQILVSLLDSMNNLSDQLNTDAILARTEMEIINRHPTWLKTGDKVVICAGYHAALPGLCNTVKLAFFGDAIRSEKEKTYWSKNT